MQIGLVGNVHGWVVFQSAGRFGQWQEIDGMGGRWGQQQCEFEPVRKGRRLQSEHAKEFPFKSVLTRT
jgi:hypothetical protein